MAAFDHIRPFRKNDSQIRIWNDFKKVEDDVEKCEYEYEAAGSQEETRKMWCQLSDIFSGTLKHFNVTDRIETVSFRKFLSLPKP